MPTTDATLFGVSLPSTARLPDLLLRVRPSLGLSSMVSFRMRATMKETASSGAYTAPAAEMGFYDLLGIPESVSLRDIKLAYKHLPRKYHPDVSPPDRVKEYTQRFIRVQEAYETLWIPDRGRSTIGTWPEGFTLPSPQGDGPHTMTTR
ncbi:unnamed protein product [Linum trigynum]|uniref:J domain-containing protein n=1 Tax=Linum trigynum TaxID=586398 RepID=A0AAV2FY11_9ROSI